MKKTVLAKDIHDFLMKPITQCHLPCSYDDVTEDEPYQIVSDLTCMTDRFSYLLRRCFGLYYDAELRTITYDRSCFDSIFAICGLLHHEFDETERLGSCDTLLWDMLGCGSDDDIDFNGSYIIAALELLILFDNNH